MKMKTKAATEEDMVWFTWWILACEDGDFYWQNRNTSISIMSETMNCFKTMHRV